MNQSLTLPDTQQMTIDEKERALFRMHADAIEAEATAIIADIAANGREGAERAAAWRVQQRDYLKQVDASPIARLKEYYREKWAGMNAEYKGYVEPCELWMKKVKAKMDAWYLAETERIRLANIKANAKAIAKAEDQQAQKVQLFIDLGKPAAAQAAAQRPLSVAPPTLVMPKIKNAVWKKTFVVQIDDLGAVLRHIAKNQEYHKLINEELLIGKLEALAGQLDGNMKKFPGLRCFESASSSAVGGPK